MEPAEGRLTAPARRFYRRNGYRIVDPGLRAAVLRKFRRCRSAVDHGNDTPERLPEFIERIKKDVYRDPLARHDPPIRRPGQISLVIRARFFFAVRVAESRSFRLRA